MKPVHKLILATVGLGAVAWLLTESAEQLRGNDDGEADGNTEPEAGPLAGGNTRESRAE